MCPSKSDLANGPVVIGESEFRLIKAWQARNYDGTPAVWEPGTASGERECIQEKCLGSDFSYVYINHWLYDNNCSGVSASIRRVDLWNDLWNR